MTKQFFISLLIFALNFQTTAEAYSIKAFLTLDENFPSKALRMDDSFIITTGQNESFGSTYYYAVVRVNGLIESNWCADFDNFNHLALRTELVSKKFDPSTGVETESFSTDFKPISLQSPVPIFSANDCSLANPSSEFNLELKAEVLKNRLPKVFKYNFSTSEGDKTITISFDKDGKVSLENHDSERPKYVDCEYRNLPKIIFVAGTAIGSFFEENQIGPAWIDWFKKSSSLKCLRESPKEYEVTFGTIDGDCYKTNITNEDGFFKPVEKSTQQCPE